MSGVGYVPVPLGPQFDDSNLSESVDDSAQNNEGRSKKSSRFSLDYYRSYFDVNTCQVIHRSLAGLIPFSERFSLASSIRPTPDLYGPFWITITLIFSVAFSGSIYEYFESKNKAVLSTFNFGRVTISAALIFIYWCFLPAVLAVVVWFRRRNTSTDIGRFADESDLKLSSLFTELLAIYGYSMIAFVPVSVLLCVPVYYFQLILIGIACVVSLSVLSSATWSTFRQRRERLAVGLLVLIVIAHVVMTVSLSLVFFHQPTLPTRPIPPIQPPQQLSDAESHNGAPFQEKERQQPEKAELLRNMGNATNSEGNADVAERENAVLEKNFGEQSAKILA